MPPDGAASLMIGLGLKPAGVSLVQVTVDSWPFHPGGFDAVGSLTGMISQFSAIVKPGGASISMPPGGIIVEIVSKRNCTMFSLNLMFVV